VPEPDRPLVAGVDGCRSGWVAVLLDPQDLASAHLQAVRNFSDLLDQYPQIAKLAVDMPIGLPDRIGRGGRGPETAVRPLLGMRQSSVFSIPARSAVYCEDYREACDMALNSSDPPKKVSKQAFHLFPKIRELDQLMSVDLEETIYEVHPEVAFWRLNGGAEMSLPKKIKGTANPEGLAQRRGLLEGLGLPTGLFEAKRPKGVGADDVVDAAVNSLIAKRLLERDARPFPEDFQRDGRGLRMAIWA